MMTTDSDMTSPASIFDAHPAYGRYMAHHTSRRIWLLFRAGVIYTVIVIIAQIVTINLSDDQARIVLMLVYGIVAGALLWWVLHLWNREVILYEKGFTYQQGSQIGQFYYHDIEHIYEDIQRLSWLGFLNMRRYSYKMITEHDETLLIDNVYSDTGQLINRLDAYTTRDRMPALLHQLDEGNSVIIGDFRITRDELSADGRSIAWDQVSGWQVKNAIFTISTPTDNAWYQRPVAEVDNVMLLIALLKHVSPPNQRGG